MLVVQRFATAELSICMYFDSSKQLRRQRLWDVRQHAGVLVRPPYPNRPFANFPLEQFAPRRMMPTQLSIDDHPLCIRYSVVRFSTSGELYAERYSGHPRSPHGCGDHGYRLLLPCIS